MATTNQSINKDELESVVNRWLLDFYLSLAVEYFQNHQNDDFCSIRDIIDCVLGRPAEPAEDQDIKISVLHFLSRINEGEKIDTQFEPDQSITPLESALHLLEHMRTALPIPQEDFDDVCTLLKDMVVTILIKNEKFNKAKELLYQYFPKPMRGKRAVFERLIHNKTIKDKIIEQLDFQQFKKTILDFCHKCCNFSSVPFLHKAAKIFLEKRFEGQDEASLRMDEQEHSSSSSPEVHTISFRPCKCPVIHKIRLEVAYKALAEDLEKKSFSDLESEVETEAQERNRCCLHHSSDPNTGNDLVPEGQTQRNPSSPIEAFPAEQPLHTNPGHHTPAASPQKLPYSVARLVVEPDSQPSSQCTVEEHPGETEMQPEGRTTTTEKDTQCPITDEEIEIPSRKLSRSSKREDGNRASTAECLTDTDEDSAESVENGEVESREVHEQSNGSLNRSGQKLQESSTASEEDSLGSQTPSKSPCLNPCVKLIRCVLSEPVDEEISIIDSSYDNSPGVSSNHDPQKSSTPHKACREERPSKRKFKSLFKAATETKSSWPDEDSFFPSKGSVNGTDISSSEGRRRKWTEEESKMLKEGVLKFGEGNWSKIKAYYSFNHRTNVNLKDKWRTMKRQKLV